MVRESKIKELVDDKVVPIINDVLNQFGFKYQKSKRFFLRQDSKGFNQIINLFTPFSPIFFDDKTEQLFLTFNIYTQIEIPNYEKWYLEKFAEKANFTIRSKQFTSQIEISFDDFEKDNFYEPTESQKFKRSVTISLMGDSFPHKNIIPLSEFLKEIIPQIISNLSINSDLLNIYKNVEFRFQHIYLLVYGKYLDYANEQFTIYYDFLIDEIESKIKISETEASGSIAELDRLIKYLSKVSNLSFTNPFKRSIKILENQNDVFNFSINTNFGEKIRFDTSQFDIKSININSIGEILIFANNQNIIKLNSTGEILFETELETKNGYDKIFWGVPSGIIKGTNDFFVNNLIITSDNKILELQLPIQKLSKGKLQNPHINDLSFWNVKNKYLVIYEDNFIVYNIEGQVEKTINITQKYGSKIFIEKEWIVIQKRDSANIILDFQGNEIATYEYANANNNYEFSINYEYLICFFYSTKSQFFDLTNNKKGTLWAHPTFIKDYKEKMYDDINHNFGMNIAKFSPDNKYIIGGADHGKYVAWTLPKLERIELIPQPEMVKRLEPHISTRFSDGKSEDIITKAELVVLENQTFLKNRNNEISKIVFFENGDVFITELGYGKFVLSWDRNFNNLTYKNLDGKLDYHSNKFLTKKTKTELKIYEQI